MWRPPQELIDSYSSGIEKVLQYQFKRRGLLQEALTHTSWPDATQQVSNCPDPLPHAPPTPMAPHPPPPLSFPHLSSGETEADLEGTDSTCHSWLAVLTHTMQFLLSFLDSQRAPCLYMFPQHVILLDRKLQNVTTLTSAICPCRGTKVWSS